MPKLAPPMERVLKGKLKASPEMAPPMKRAINEQANKYKWGAGVGKKNR